MSASKPVSLSPEEKALKWTVVNSGLCIACQESPYFSHVTHNGNVQWHHVICANGHRHCSFSRGERITFTFPGTCHCPAPTLPEIIVPVPVPGHAYSNGARKLYDEWITRTRQTPNLKGESKYKYIEDDVAKMFIAEKSGSVQEDAIIINKSAADRDLTDKLQRYETRVTLKKEEDGEMATTRAFSFRLGKIKTDYWPPKDAKTEMEALDVPAHIKKEILFMYNYVSSKLQQYGTDDEPDRILLLMDDALLCIIKEKAFEIMNSAKWMRWVEDVLEITENEKAEKAEEAAKAEQDTKESTTTPTPVTEAAKSCIDCGERLDGDQCEDCVMKCRRYDCLKPWDQRKTGRTFCDECVKRDHVRTKAHRKQFAINSGLL